jgi:hypothetical protein
MFLPTLIISSCPWPKQNGGCLQPYCKYCARVFFWKPWKLKKSLYWFSTVLFHPYILFADKHNYFNDTRICIDLIYLECCEVHSYRNNLSHSPYHISVTWNIIPERISGEVQYFVSSEDQSEKKFDQKLQPHWTSKRALVWKSMWTNVLYISVKVTCNRDVHRSSPGCVSGCTP